MGTPNEEGDTVSVVQAMTAPGAPREPGRDDDLARLAVDYRLGDWVICDDSFERAIRLAREARDERDALREGIRAAVDLWRDSVDGSERTLAWLALEALAGEAK